MRPEISDAAIVAEVCQLRPSPARLHGHRTRIQAAHRWPVDRRGHGDSRGPDAQGLDLRRCRSRPRRGRARVRSQRRSPPFSGRLLTPGEPGMGVGPSTVPVSPGFTGLRQYSGYRSGAFVARVKPGWAVAPRTFSLSQGTSRVSPLITHSSGAVRTCSLQGPRMGPFVALGEAG